MHNSRRKTGDNVFYWENLCVNLRSMYMYHVCLHLLSDDIYVCILIGCRCTPLQGDWRPCMYLPSDDIHLYVYAPLRQGLATVCFYWRESIDLRSVCLHLHVPSDDEM